MGDGDPTGRFLWHQLLTTDRDAAAEFYRDLVGWSVEPLEMAGTRYQVWAADGCQVAAAMQLTSEALEVGTPAHWLPYVGTPDLDETVRAAEELGGHVLAPARAIPDAGRFAVLQDPQEAVFAALQPPDTPEEDPDPRPGFFSWHELATTDHESALSFYEELFGWEAGTPHDMGELGTYQIFGLEGTELGGLYDLPPDDDTPPSWLPYVMVGDIDEAVETLESLGGRVLNGPMPVPGGDWVVQAMDPQGAVFALHATGEGAE